jgi:hypothetical protein
MTDLEQHAARYLTFAEGEVPHLLSGGRSAALDRFERDYEQYCRALAYFIDGGDADQAARLVRALRTFWTERGRTGEGRAWIERVLALPQACARTAARATLLDHAGALAHTAQDFHTMRVYGEEVLAIRRELGLTRMLPVSLAHLALAVRFADHDLARARLLNEESLQLSRELGDTYSIRAGLYRLAQISVEQGRAAEAEALLRENVTLARQTGTDWALGLVLRAFGAVAALRGQAERAVRLASAGKTQHEAAGINLGRHAEEAWFERQLAPAYHALDEPSRAAATAAGRTLPLEQALAEATGTEAALRLM